MKYFNFKRNNFYKFFRITTLRSNNFVKLFRSLYLNKYNIKRIFKYLDFRHYRFSKIYKYINLVKLRLAAMYLVGVVIISCLIFLSRPYFFNFSKSDIENVICAQIQIKCIVEGKISYAFFPSPRIKVKNLILQDVFEKKKNLGKISNVEFIIPANNLFEDKKFNYKKIKLRDAKFRLNTEKFSKYRDFFTNTINLKNLNLNNGEIEFFDKENYVTAIKDIDFEYNFDKNSNDLILKGSFLGDSLYLNLSNSKKSQGSPKTLLIKLKNLNFLTKINFFNSNSSENIFSGNALIKKDKFRFTTIFDFKNNRILLKKSNIKNSFSDGQVTGKVSFQPFFNFDLNMDLNTFNFNTLSNLIVKMDKDKTKNLFKINKKINGQLNLSLNKVFSKHSLINSLESQIKFVNGNIFIDQLLLSLGKLGAADLTGVIKNDKKFTNFKFENNIFIDDMKRFYSKFGVYNKQEDSYNLFTSGNLDLTNLSLHFYEISGDKKFNVEEMNYIEKEFNDLLLDDGYITLFNFSNLKKFVKLMTEENN